jgi:predicted DNA-binding ribbon-helix-helix protein
VKHSVEINGRATSIKIEDEFWSALHQIAAEQSVGVQAIVARIAQHEQSNLSAAVRVFVLKHYQRG